MDNEFAQDPSLVRDFLVESEELLQRMDQDMVTLESAPNDEELLNRVFRALHTIKGTAGFLGFEPLVRVGHSAEDVLNAVRRGELRLDRRVMDALLAARDQLGHMLKDLGQGGLQQYQLDALLAQLHEVQSTQAAPAPQAEPPAQDVSPAQPELRILPAEPPAPPEPAKPQPLIVEESPTSKTAEPPSAQPKNAGTQPSSQTMRVDAHKLDELINLIGELVLERNRLVQLSRDCSSGKLSHDDLDSFLAQSTARLSFITEELQTAGLKTRMVPIETVFHRFPRLVRDVAHSLQKEVQLLIRGEDTELDKTMVELIADPLVHLVRNSLDHGIERPEVRERSGKPRQGTIRLEASQEGDQIVISISDDGAGINPDRVGLKAIEMGLLTPERLRLLSPREILDLIFLPGFSTAEKASELSGRGVGLDVVRSNLKRLNGSVDIDSHPGTGTTFLLRLPLTLAILPVLLVSVAEEIYALPLRSVVETAQVNLQHVHRIEGSEVLCLRDETLPLLRLAQLFDSDAALPVPGAPSSSAAGHARKVVILGVTGRRVALLVDRLLGQESTVVRPLGTHLHQCSSVAGASISGDGRVRLVLDPAGLIATSQNSTRAGRAFA
ncbi:MAG TPA: chemotaxis protein CheA [Candidatus Acidoferrales bacterium]|nr:chemotaxis protein CheA [Candidatus Acidoferrales bacterium]